MAKVCINREKCNHCGACIKACPWGSIYLEAEIPVVDSHCHACGLCAEACPVGAIHTEAFVGAPADKAAWSGVMFYVQHTSQGIHPITLEMAGIAAALANKTGDKLYAVSVTGKPDVDFSALEGKVDCVFSYNGMQYANFMDDVYADALIDCIQRVKPQIVLLGATIEGRTLAPRAAVAFRTGLTADCTELDINEDGDLLQIRPAFGGDIMAEILTAHTRPQFATVREKVMRPTEALHTKGLDIREMACLPVDTKALRKRFNIVRQEALVPKKDIASQRILVAIGNGVECKEDIPLFESFAERIGGMLAGSRLLVEKGWLPGERQIGISGKSVGCDLLIACGVSGSVQFLAGISGVKQIVAINKDKNAPIFAVAHTLICADMYDIIPAFLKKSG